ncbi:hypothetical protein [Microlunatus ginsengisoli]|uniref:hypothetical protein n=1 Tax=Microlunatus ginsengisoli TaxID=363863 RepID=UPI0031D092E7
MSGRTPAARPDGASVVARRGTGFGAGDALLISGVELPVRDGDDEVSVGVAGGADGDPDGPADEVEDGDGKAEDSDALGGGGVVGVVVRLDLVGDAVGVDDSVEEGAVEETGDGAAAPDRAADTVSALAQGSPATHRPPLGAAVMLSFVPAGAVHPTVATNVAATDLCAPELIAAGSVHVSFFVRAFSARPCFASSRLGVVTVA